MQTTRFPQPASPESTPAPSQSSAAGARDEWKAAFHAPSVTLPKGGGAIRGIGEKFAANPVTGTGSFSVPIATSPGRSGFGPQLSLSYDSGAGNGPFGFGWTLALPSITRKTDKRLPLYRDAEESDVFVLSGAEDLVPLLGPDGERHVDLLTAPGFRIHRYRPRIEGLFARIERWTELATGDVHWRSLSGDNVLTLYGRRPEARICDPLDPRRVFSWLTCETRDDKGNAVVYEYQPEDGQGIDPGLASERNRGPDDDPRRTANRYLKRIRYGNRTPLLVDGRRPRDLPAVAAEDWMFEVVFDHGDHPGDAPTPLPTATWPHRPDAYSSYRSGFEVRTARLCQRVLMFHHFEAEPEVGRNCLVRSTDFSYTEDGAQDSANATAVRYTFLRSVTQTGYRRQGEGYLARSLPPVEFGYTEPEVQHTVHEVPATSLENLPIGVDEAGYQWVDLHGEGLPGILTEQAGAWFYRRNLSPLEGQAVRFGPLERVAVQPNAALARGAQFMDLAGDGQADLVMLEGPLPGLYEHDDAEGWQPFKPFTSRLNRPIRDPNLRMLDLDGDGHADLLITEDDAFLVHAGLGEAGFGAARRIVQSFDEEHGPRLVFAEEIQSIFLADMNGDGLTDLMRIRNGQVCYWPNLGHGRFGAKVTMDGAPLFDHPDHFDPRRLRLADIDGSGTIDLIYLHREGVRLYFNHCGNGWNPPQALAVFPRVDNLVHVHVADLLGNGTACLVWSSPLQGDAGRPMRYVSLMGDQKPHLLVRVVNNLGAETRIHYASSTRHYLRDKVAGRPWITKLPFPVHVVEKVETFDHISRNRFATRYAYHHGHFDAHEREFRGFGMVEQWDTEQLAALMDASELPPADNLDEASHVPPVLTRTWFHTGIWLGRDHVSDHFAGLLDALPRGEYFREPGLTDAEFRAQLLPDTVLPPGLTLDEEREACRALKGSMLRQEVYGLDGTAKQGVPYSVVEQNLAVRLVQPRAGQRHAVFFTHALEALTCHYERNPADPRVQHALTLEVDDVGNVLKQLAIGYGRRGMVRGLDPLDPTREQPNPGLLALPEGDRPKQTTTLLTYSESRYTHGIDQADAYRLPLPCEAFGYELTGYTPSGQAGRYQAVDVVEPDSAQPGRLRNRFEAEVPYEATASGTRCRRLIERARTLYRADDLTALLPLGRIEPLALPGEAYQLALTPGLIQQVFQRDGVALLPNPEQVLPVSETAQAPGAPRDRGGYVDLEGDGHWWVPSGRIHLSPGADDTPAQELAHARQHFYLPARYRDPFHTASTPTDTTVSLDRYDLLVAETRDALDNRVTVEQNDYRVLQPRLVSDPNRNRTEVVFDALGLVVGTAVMGKAPPAKVEGDTLAGFQADLTEGQIDAFATTPREPLSERASQATDVVHELLNGASTRIVYDLHRYRRLGQPSFSATVARETHVSDLAPSQRSKLQIAFSYSDGYGREIQNKRQAGPGPLDVNDPASPVANPRWITSGWAVFNNKGKPVRQYEPYFSATHTHEFGVKVGVSPVIFYDPVGRAVATLHPNHTYDKVLFDPWQQTSYDVNDTCAPPLMPEGAPKHRETGDPRTDPDIKLLVASYFKTREADPEQPWLTWFDQRITDALGVEERRAARKAQAHADTPSTAHFDALGRPFLTVARNRVVCPGHPLHGLPDEEFRTRVVLDLEGNQREVLDERKLPDEDNLPLGPLEQRIVMRYAYDLLGNRIHQLSMEAGARWMQNDVAGQPIRAWDSRGHQFTHTYDPLHRPVGQTVRGINTEGAGASDPRTLGRDILVDRIEYGEATSNADALNLRTRIARQFDSAGVLTNGRLGSDGQITEACDFKGNLLCSSRRLATDYHDVPDWSANVPLEDEYFEGSTRYNALNHPIQLVAPHSSLTRPEHPNKFNVTQHSFNETSLLGRVDVWLERASEPGALLDQATDLPSPVGVNNIAYDAEGQRLRIDYKNGASTFYDHDELTLRLRRLYTRRGVTFTEDCDNPQPPPLTIAAPDATPPGRPCGLQNLHYSYDPAGNITHIQDDAQQTVYFSNQRIDPSNDYTYDALSRLIEATGREHLGQGGEMLPHSHNDAGRIRQPHPNSGELMARYCEKYVYDALGNFLAMSHHRACADSPGWTRHYTYQEACLSDATKVSNRLSGTTLGAVPDTYSDRANNLDGYDSHGNMLRMPHLGGGLMGPNMHWDYKDQLRLADLGGGGTAFYVYDATGQRIRKVVERKNGNHIEERIYVSGFEVFRKHTNQTVQITTGTAMLERETLHVMDNKQRIAIVETRTLQSLTLEEDSTQLIRNEFGNHLGTVSLELDMQAKILSYEEYSPFGSSTYQTTSRTEMSKRFGFTGKERDEESGLHYHGARYYAAWLGRWTAADRLGFRDSNNSYLYVNGRPTILHDPSGNYGEAGHFYTVYFLSLAAGFDADTSFQNALYAQLPDEINSLDAIQQQKNALLESGPSELKFWAERERDVVQVGLHSLSGGSSTSERLFTRRALSEAQPGTIEFGFLLHRFGDTYAHSVIGEEGKLYETGWGHLRHFHEPDQIHMRPEQYRLYAKDLFESLSKIAIQQGHNPRLTSKQVDIFAQRVGGAVVRRHHHHYDRKAGDYADYYTIDTEATEQGQIFIIRTLSKLLMPEPTMQMKTDSRSCRIQQTTIGTMKDYEPEREETMSWDEFYKIHPDFLRSTTWRAVSSAVFSVAKRVGHQYSTEYPIRLH